MWKSLSVPWSSETERFSTRDVCSRSSRSALLDSSVGQRDQNALDRTLGRLHLQCSDGLNKLQCSGGLNKSGIESASFCRGLYFSRRLAKPRYWWSNWSSLAAAVLVALCHGYYLRYLEAGPPAPAPPFQPERALPESVSDNRYYPTLRTRSELRRVKTLLLLHISTRLKSITSLLILEGAFVRRRVNPFTACASHPQALLLAFRLFLDSIPPLDAAVILGAALPIDRREATLQ